MAKMKICLDAGHYGKYNQSPANSTYYESDMVWKLHLLQKKYLEELGFEVILTRADQATNKGLYDRGAMSKDCDLFISDHSNAVGSYVNENVDYPLAYVSIDGRGNEIGQKLADCVHDVMGTSQIGQITARRGDNGDYYGVIRGATAVGTIGMILEHSFHTNTKMTNWLLNDNNLDKLAKAEAECIAEYLGVKVTSGTTNKASQKINALSGTVKVTYTGADGLNVRTAPCMGDNISQIVYNGTYTVVGISEDGDWYKLKSGVYITTNEKYVQFTATETKTDNEFDVPFSVKVSIPDLNIRTGAGTEYIAVGFIPIGVYTIVEVKAGKGSTKGWGRLKSGAGWISLDFVDKI